MLLRVEEASVHYKKVAALKGISVAVPEGSIVTIIGANGAGKSTTLRLISGLERPTAGAVWFEDQRIDGLAADKIGVAINLEPHFRELPDPICLPHQRCAGICIQLCRVESKGHG